MDVSIIIPVYNAEKFIFQCLESVEAQTFRGEMECILVDDSSQDHSLQIIEEKQCQIRNSVILRQDHNQGPSAARNRGIREAKGEYVFFLDADDTIMPDCIDNLYRQAKEFNLDYVQGTYRGEIKKSLNSVILCTEGRASKAGALDKKKIKRTLLNYNVIPFTPHNRLVRRQMLLDHNLFFDERIRVREDFLWMTFVAKYVERFGYCSEVTYSQGYNEDSLTHNVNMEREIKGYTVLIRTMCENIDPFQRGAQLELILSALEMFKGMLGEVELKKYYAPLETLFLEKNKICEKTLYYIYLRMKNDVLRTKLLHLLVRLYMIKD